MKSLFKSLSLMAVAAILFASCDKDMYTVTILTNDPALGQAYGGGKYEKDASVRIYATPVGDNQFVKWSDGERDNPRTIIVKGDITLTALFSVDGSDPQPDPGPNPGYEPIEAISVTFGDTMWHPIAMTRLEVSSSVWQMQMPSSNEASGQVAGFYMPAAVGSYHANEYSCYYVNGFDDVVVIDGQEYPHWQANVVDGEVQCEGNVTALDLTAGTLSLTLTATMRNMYNYANGLPEELWPMSVTVDNVKWIVTTPSN